MDNGRPREVSSERRLLADAVFGRLSDEILSGELPDGHILRDHELAVRLNVSRTPVREAIMRLERIGLVEIEPSRFTRVTTITPESIREHRELAGYMAGVAAHMAVARLSDDELAHTLDLVDGVEAALADPAAASAARMALFGYLSRHSGNPIHHGLIEDAEAAFTRAIGRAPLRDITLAEQQAECAGIRDALRSP